MGLRIKNSLVVRRGCDGSSGYLPVNGSEYEVHITAKSGNKTLGKGSPSGPIFVSFTPLDVINSSALFTFSAICTLIRGALL